MIKKKIDIDKIASVIKEFYDQKKHHFVTLNAVKIDTDLLEIQYIFTNYDDNHITLFYDEISFNSFVPSITKIVANAYISEMEMVDMFGINIANTKKGLYLDSDSKSAPLKDVK